MDTHDTRLLQYLLEAASIAGDTPLIPGGTVGTPVQAPASTHVQVTYASLLGSAAWLLSSGRNARRAPCVVLQAAKDAEGAADKLRLELISLKTRMGGTGSDVAVAPEDGRHTPLLPSKERDTLEPDLAAFLKKARTSGLRITSTQISRFYLGVTLEIAAATPVPISASCAIFLDYK